MTEKQGPALLEAIRALSEEIRIERAARADLERLLKAPSPSEKGDAIPVNDQAAVEPPEFLTPDEAAVLLRVNIGTLYEVIKSSSPPWAKSIGRQVRISRAALLKWFESETVAPAKRRRVL
jgi:excisionase family DNA binding protein